MNNSSIIAVSLFSGETDWQYLVTGTSMEEVLSNLQNDFTFHGDDLGKAYGVFAVVDNVQSREVEAVVNNVISKFEQESGV